MNTVHFEQLMQINEEAFNEKQFNVAYHALAAALACAKDQKDADLCLMVEATAKSQSEWINNYAPRYEHSSISARGRGVTKDGIFTSLAHQAKSTAVVLNS